MIIAKKIVVDGIQGFNMAEKDTIKVKVKDQDEFVFTTPIGWEGAITITIKGELIEKKPI